MFIDLNVPAPQFSSQPQQGQSQSKKGKGKQPAVPATVTFAAGQISALENRIDLLVHLGYTVLALNQTIQTKLDPKSHVNVLDPLLSQLRKRSGLVLLKRLTIVLDEESEKGFGLTTQNTPLVTSYDILSLLPTTQGSLSLACLTHTLPSPLTTHVIALPLSLPRLPFRLKHTLIRTALKNGAVFELSYGGALGAEADVGSGLGEGGAGAKRNWWANAREVVRVTKGKGVLVSGGVVNDADLRGARDVSNLMTVVGLTPDAAHHAATKIPQSLILRAQTRRTYRAVLSEPKIVIPNVPPTQSSTSMGEPQPAQATDSTEVVAVTGTLPAIAPPEQSAEAAAKNENGKRPRDEGAPATKTTPTGNTDDAGGRKRKKKKSKNAGA
ncbi:RNase P subunit p30-domain-containing protein [Fomitopsis serialis]|uniref:RNase P subunit p30-domain-containing protein n=1 Tax=Fomitopsis serialis TaxID=139415 RepID=UPI0020088A11|nr:RNase P subunit p30-domain-containing protein [Neoantrodia serialis]KAH9918052.1 RNase P subunit p30-domain-containing protein [Neoantrodia serialis]